MILSSLITPFRIYSNYWERSKFNVDCKHFCDYELITDKTRLLPFQFTRPASPFIIDKMFLRSDCNEFYNKIVPDEAAKFKITSYWSTSGITISNGIARHLGTSYTGFIQKLIPGLTGKKITVKIIINEIVLNGSFSYFFCNLTNGTTPYAYLSSGEAKVYEYTFTATSNTLKLEFAADNGEYFDIVEFSVYEEIDYLSGLGDILIPDLPDIKSSGPNDIISYCAPKLLSTLPCGKFYLIIKTTNGKFYFSETITVKNFIPELSPYILLEWYNACDLQDVKYTEFSCIYKNRLYIDGPITKPQYPFKDEADEDGNGVLNITFQKWEKTDNIIVAKAPEFIVDSLTAMRLHKYIKFYPPLKLEQNKIVESIDAESVEYEINYVLNDCAANVDLKLLLKNRMIDSSCCKKISVDCIDCTYDPTEQEMYLTYDGTNWSLFVNVYTPELGSHLVPFEAKPGDLICNNNDGKKYYFTGSTYVLVPNITSVVNNSNVSMTITGNTYYNTFLMVHIYYSNGGINYTYPLPFTALELQAGITIKYADLPITLVDCTEFHVKFDAYDHNCDYGFSNIKTLIIGGSEC